MSHSTAQKELLLGGVVFCLMGVSLNYYWHSIKCNEPILNKLIIVVFDL
jgi:hypothetical protein